MCCSHSPPHWPDLSLSLVLCQLRPHAEDAARLALLSLLWMEAAGAHVCLAGVTRVRNGRSLSPAPLGQMRAWKPGEDRACPGHVASKCRASIWTRSGHHHFLEEVTPTTGFDQVHSWHLPLYCHLIHFLICFSHSSPRCAPFICPFYR